MEAPISEDIERFAEKLFNLNEVDKCTVKDKFGNTKSFKEIREGCMCIIVFIRVSR